MPATVPLVSLLLLSGGVGTRSRHHEPKQFYELSGHPMIAHSVICAARSERVGEIVVNAPPGFEERTCEIMESYRGITSYKIVEGGTTRQESSCILVRSAK